MMCDEKNNWFFTAILGVFVTFFLCFISFIIILFIGILKVDASTIGFYKQSNNNTYCTTNASTTEVCWFSYSSGFTNNNQVGAFITQDVNILKDYVYEIEMTIDIRYDVFDRGINDFVPGWDYIGNTYENFSVGNTLYYGSIGGTSVSVENRTWEKTLSYARDGGSPTFGSKFTYKSSFISDRNTNKITFMIPFKQNVENEDILRYQIYSYTFKYSTNGQDFTVVGDNIIQNSNENTDKVINNNNSNTDKITQNNDKNTDKITDSLDKNTEEQKETNDYLKDDKAPESDISGLGNITGLLPPGPLDTLLNIPIQFLSKIVTGLNETCSPLRFNFFWDMPIEFPCFGSAFYSRMPAVLEYSINLIPGVLILIKYFKYLYKKVERATSFNTNSDDLWGAI